MAGTGSKTSAVILFVEEDTDDSRRIRSHLISLGYQVVLPGDLSQEGRVDDSVDLVLWDADQVPLAPSPLHGSVRKMREKRFLPLLLLMQDEERADRAMVERRADDFLLAPFSLTALQARVRTLLQLKRMREQVERRSNQLRRRMADLKQLTRVKAGFISVVSHELRTPLTPITAYTEMLIDGELGPLAPAQREALGVVLDKAIHMRRLIEDLLQFATLERGKGRMQMQGVALERVLEQVVQPIAQQYEGKGISLERQWPANLPPALADPAQIQDVVRHLLDNAYKFTPNGGHIVVRAFPETPKLTPRHRKLEGTMGITVSVADTGIGIPEDQQPFIFDHFYQADTSLTRRHSGMGLGLALAQRILSEHGASLRVESKEGRGSVFSFTLSAAGGEIGGRTQNEWGTH